MATWAGFVPIHLHMLHLPCGFALANKDEAEGKGLGLSAKARQDGVCR
jgi:hypothetical protein